MKVRSRGLGRKELLFDFKDYTVTEEKEDIIISGIITNPVHWDFSIRVSKDDLGGIINIVTRRTVLKWLIRSFFKKKSNV